MVIGVRNLEWSNHNQQRRYPITADSTMEDLTGTFRLPDDLIVALYLPVHWGLNVAAGRFFVMKVNNQPTGVQLIIGYAGSAGDIEVASALISAATHTENKVYILVGIGDFAGSRGSIVIGNLDALSAQPAGAFEFELTGSRLESDAIRPNIRAVTGLIFQNGSEQSSVMSGYVRVRAGRNTRFRVVEESGKDPLVHWDAIDGAGLTEDCVCDEGLAPPIRTINGIPPDGAGNFRFLGNDCLEIDSGSNSLTLKDVCSEPCCGCKELEAVTQALESFGERATTLENFLVGLEARVTQMDLVVLGARLGDRGCTPATECPE